MPTHTPAEQAKNREKRLLDLATKAPIATPEEDLEGIEDTEDELAQSPNSLLEFIGTELNLDPDKANQFVQLLEEHLTGTSET